MKYSADTILNMHEPWELFSGDRNSVKTEYLELTRLWHPDLHRNSREANEVMTKINMLYKQCLEMISSGRWEAPGYIRLSDKDKRIYEIHYKVTYEFELGYMYIGKTYVLYLIDTIHEDLFDNAVKMIKNLTFANDSMKKEMTRFLPAIISKFETLDNQLGLLLKKSADLLLLKDVLKYYGARLTPRHAAWILSNLYNLACYLDYCGLSHNAIDLDTFFISPEHHSGALLGGWWYAVHQNNKMLGVPEKIYNIMPPQVKDNPNGSIITDLESIRLIGRELLGNANGARLAYRNDVPIQMSNWLRGAASDNALEDYSNWQGILDASFGPRCFIEMDLNEEKLYSKI